jgi:hypothetical protein
VSTGDKVAILVDINLADFVSILGLEDDTLAIVDSLDNDLGKRNVSELKFTLVATLF